MPSCCASKRQSPRRRRTVPRFHQRWRNTKEFPGRPWRTIVERTGARCLKRSPRNCCPRVDRQSGHSAAVATPKAAKWTILFRLCLKRYEPSSTFAFRCLDQSYGGEVLKRNIWLQTLENYRTMDFVTKQNMFHLCPTKNGNADQS